MAEPAHHSKKIFAPSARCGIVVGSWALLSGMMLGVMSQPRVVRGEEAPVTTAKASELDDQARAAIEKGLAWLATQQAKDGAYGTQSHYGPHVGITGLVGMAFLSHGDTPNRGPYGATVARALRFVLANGS